MFMETKESAGHKPKVHELNLEEENSYKGEEASEIVSEK